MLLQNARHPVNIGHLVMGIAFLGFVVVWATIEADLVGGDDIRWPLPVPWILAGLAGLLATTLPARSADTLPEPESWQAESWQAGAPDDTVTNDRDDTTGRVR